MATIASSFLSCSAVSNRLGSVGITTSKVHWQTWEKAIQNANSTPNKKIMVKIFTDNCLPCDEMDKSVFADKVTGDYINKHYHAIKFDAHYEKPISLQGTTYEYIFLGKDSTHELAAKLLNGQMGYPSVVIMDSNFKVIEVIRGKRSRYEFEMYSTYYAEGHYKKTSFSSYEDTHMPWIR